MSHVPRVEINNKGEFRDRQLTISIGMPIEGIRPTGREDFNKLSIYLTKWIGLVVKLLAEETFSGYFSK